MVYQPCRYKDRSVAAEGSAPGGLAADILSAYMSPAYVPFSPALPGKSHYRCNYFQEDVLRELTNISELLSLINRLL